jgi:hypothetical protein
VSVDTAALSYDDAALSIGDADPAAIGRADVERRARAGSTRDPAGSGRRLATRAEIASRAPAGRTSCKRAERRSGRGLLTRGDAGVNIGGLLIGVVPCPDSVSPARLHPERQGEDRDQGDPDHDEGQSLALDQPGFG